MSAQGKILVVEDDTKTAQAIRRGLILEGYACEVCFDGLAGFQQLEQERFDLIVLDWMLPGRDGMEIVRELRGRGTFIPVLLLTARDAIEDRVEGLEGGADDYLVKPFAFAELLARIRTLLRRSGPEIFTRKRVGPLEIDPVSRRAWRNGKEVLLTPREFNLLTYLMSFEGQIVTREMIARDVWREPNRHTPLDNVVDVHMANLRKKVDDRTDSRLIHTVRGVGFTLRKVEEA